MPVVNPEILIWARETSGLSVEDAARKLQLKDTAVGTAVEKLLAYEGGKPPSRPLLVRMAKQYKKPLLSFYLDAPPRKGDRGQDFRTLPEEIDAADNYYVDALIRDTKARQSLLKETLIEEDATEALAFVGSVSLDNGVHEIAQAIGDALGFRLERFRSCRTPEESFKYLRALAEEIGVFVLLIGNLGSHHSALDPKIFRGFALADEFAPFIVINDQDARSAWSFTLLHELAHLWLGQTGVSGYFSERRIEQTCNDIASELLLPAVEFNAFRPDTTDRDELAREVAAFADERKISSSLVSYRLYRNGIIERASWIDLATYFREQWLAFKDKKREQSRRQDGGPNYFVVRRNKLGEGLVRTAERMTSSGALSTTKAGLLLGVRPLNVHKLFSSGRAA